MEPLEKQKPFNNYRQQPNHQENSQQDYHKAVQEAYQDKISVYQPEEINQEKCEKLYNEVTEKNIKPGHLEKAINNEIIALNNTEIELIYPELEKMVSNYENAGTANEEIQKHINKICRYIKLLNNKDQKLLKKILVERIIFHYSSDNNKTKSIKKMESNLAHSIDRLNKYKNCPEYLKNNIDEVITAIIDVNILLGQLSRISIKKNINQKKIESLIKQIPPIREILGIIAEQGNFEFINGIDCYLKHILKIQHEPIYEEDARKLIEKGDDLFKKINGGSNLYKEAINAYIEAGVKYSQEAESHEYSSQEKFLENYNKSLDVLYMAAKLTIKYKNNLHPSEIINYLNKCYTYTKKIYHKINEKNYQISNNYRMLKNNEKNYYNAIESKNNILHNFYKEIEWDQYERDEFNYYLSKAYQSANQIADENQDSHLANIAIINFEKAMYNEYFNKIVQTTKNHIYINLERLYKKELNRYLNNKYYAYNENSLTYMIKLLNIYEKIYDVNEANNIKIEIKNEIKCKLKYTQQSSALPYNIDFLENAVLNFNEHIEKGLINSVLKSMFSLKSLPVYQNGSVKFYFTDEILAYSTKVINYYKENIQENTDTKKIMGIITDVNNILKKLKYNEERCHQSSPNLTDNSFNNLKNLIAEAGLIITNHKK